MLICDFFFKNDFFFLPIFLKAGDVPVEFEEFHMSEVQNMASEEKLEQVLTSMKSNRVAIKGSLISFNSLIFLSQKN